MQLILCSYASTYLPRLCMRSYRSQIVSFASSGKLRALISVSIIARSYPKLAWLEKNRSGHGYMRVNCEIVLFDNAYVVSTRYSNRTRRNRAGS
jgi:hypothetical protein